MAIEEERCEWEIHPIRNWLVGVAYSTQITSVSIEANTRKVSKVDQVGYLTSFTQCKEKWKKKFGIEALTCVNLQSCTEDVWSALHQLQSNCQWHIMVTPQPCTNKDRVKVDKL